MNRRELPLLFAIFLDMVGFGAAFPDIQLRAESYGASGILIGALLASYFVVQLAASPWWGRKSDRIGRKPVLLICTTLSALSMVAYAFIPNLWGMGLSRVLAGFAAANVVVGQAYLADISTEEQRPAVMGRASAALLLGLVAGPALGGFLGKFYGNYGLGVVAAAMSALACVWIAFGIPQEKPAQEREPGAKKLVFDFSLIRETPALKRILVVAIAGWFVLACLEGTFGRLIKHTLGLDVSHFGIIFSYESLVGAGMGFALAWIGRRLSSNAIIRLGYVSLALGVALTPLAPNFGLLFVASTLWAFGLGISNPTINTVCSLATPENRQGELFGLIQATRSIGFAVGPILGGALFDLRPELPYYVAAGVALLAAVLISVPQRNASMGSESVASNG